MGLLDIFARRRRPLPRATGRALTEPLTNGDGASAPVAEAAAAPQVLAPQSAPAPAAPRAVGAAEAASPELVARVLGQLDELSQAQGLAALTGSTPPTGSAAVGARAYLSADPWKWNTPQDPRWRPYAPLSTDTLRTLARTYDVLASCIAHLKMEVSKVPIKVALRDGEEPTPEREEALREAQFFFSTLGGLGGPGERRAVFESKMLDDLLVIGANALHFEFATLGDWEDGRFSECRAIDAATIRPVVTPWGFAPGDEEICYEQWVQGAVTGRFTRREMVWEPLPLGARTDSPYPMSPVEMVAMVVYTALKSDEWNRVWLTDGNGRGKWVKIPETMTPGQATEWLDVLDMQTAGNARERHKLGVIPGDLVGGEARKDADFQAFEEGLANRVRSVMGVNPASVGHNTGQYEANQNAAMGSTREGMVAHLLEWRSGTYDDILARMSCKYLQVVEDVPVRTEDAAARASRNKTEIEGQLTINEVRAERGLDPVEGGDILLIPAGMVTLLSLTAPPPAPEAAPAAEAAPVDAAPAEDAVEPEEDASASGDAVGAHAAPQEEAASTAEPAEALGRGGSPSAEEASGGASSPEHAHEFSCVLVELGAGACEASVRWAREHLGAGGLAEDGIEEEPHITVRYGLHTSDVRDVEPIFAEAAPIRARVGTLQLFREGDTGQGYDVLVYGVESEDLTWFNHELGGLPNTSTWPTYTPHLTVAYVRPGAADAWEGEEGPLSGQVLAFDEVIFSDRDGARHRIGLSRNEARRAEALGQWERKALNRLARGQKAACSFESAVLGPTVKAQVLAGLAECEEKAQVRRVFGVARVLDGNGMSHGRDGRFEGTGGGGRGTSEAGFWGGADRDATTAQHFNGQYAVAVRPEDAARVAQEARRAFGRELSAGEWGQLAGAPDGSTVHVSVHEPDGSIQLEVEHSELLSQALGRGTLLNLSVGEGGATALYGFIATTGVVRGLGQRMMLLTIEKARLLGVRSISLKAAGSVGDRVFSGWKVWPRLGFDAPLSFAEQESLPASLAGATSLADLMASAQGRAWWEATGKGRYATFDLNPKSYFGRRSEQVRQEYMKEQEIKLGL